MQTLSYGYKKPATGDRGSVFWAALEFDITRLNSHNHDGSNSALITPTVTGTVASATAVTAGRGITPAAGPDTTQFVAGSGGAVDITVNPQIVAGTVLGTRLLLIGTDDTNTVTLNHGTGLDLNGDCVLDTNQAICLMWDGSAWRELYRRA